MQIITKYGKQTTLKNGKKRKRKTESIEYVVNINKPCIACLLYILRTLRVRIASLRKVRLRAAFTGARSRRRRHLRSRRRWVYKGANGVVKPSVDHNQLNHQDAGTTIIYSEQKKYFFIKLGQHNNLQALMFKKP